MKGYLFRQGLFSTRAIIHNYVPFYVNLYFPYRPPIMAQPSERFSL